MVGRPSSAYIHFVTNRTTSSDFNGIQAKDRMKLIGQEWKSLSEDEKNVRILFQFSPRLVSR